MIFIIVVGVAVYFIFVWRILRLERRLSALEARLEYPERLW